MNSAPSIWAARACAEYRSAALTAELLHRLLVLGVHPKLVKSCREILEDELKHTELCRSVYIESGGTFAPFELKAEDLSYPQDHSLLLTVLKSVCELFCIGETTAVPLFRSFRAQATQPLAHETLSTILADEARHSQFGWAALMELLPLTNDTERLKLLNYCHDILDNLADYHNTDFTPTQQERSWGICSGKEQSQMVSEIVPDLRKKLSKMLNQTD